MAPGRTNRGAPALLPTNKLRRGKVLPPRRTKLTANALAALFASLFVLLGVVTIFMHASLPSQDRPLRPTAGLRAVDDASSRMAQQILLPNANIVESAPKVPSSEEASARVVMDHPYRHGGNAYEGWKDVALKLAGLPSPDETLSALDDYDPFGVRSFERKLFDQESKLGRILTTDEVKSVFNCPPTDERITHPDHRHPTKAESFRNGDEGTFLFFQHLRKAGGTNFCTLAERNLPRKAQPPYFCMPDMQWSGNKNAGYLHHWSNDEIIRRMKEKGHRIAGNEWDNFDRSNHFDLPAAFASSFRRPLDRALSQFRFECIEDRGCKIKDVKEWWAKRVDLKNVYTKTFADPAVGARQYFRGTSESNARKRREFVGDALDVVSRFDIVLAMEWLAYAAPQVESILGFHDTSALTERVRPHIGQAERNDGQEKNKLGSAGIAKASWVPKEYLDPEQYKLMSEDLALDEILTDAARRMFLERLVCPSVR